MNGEYKSCYRQLNEENRKLLKKIRLYLQSRYLSEVAEDELLVDIAGMALESQKRGESFREAIGNDYESFCKELAKNSPRRSKVEGAFLILAWVLAVMGAVLPLLCLWEWIAFFISPARLDGVVLITPAAHLLKYLVFSAVAVCGWFFAFRYNHKTQTGVILVYLSVLFFGFFVFNIFSQWMPQSPVWAISAPLWMVVFAILVGTVLLAKRLAALTVAYQQQRKEKKKTLKGERHE